MAKNGTELNKSVPMILDAYKNILKYPSTAEDTGSIERSAKHFVQRALNNINGSAEFSQSMIALQLLGSDAYSSSAIFTFLFVNRAIAYVFKDVEKQSSMFKVIINPETEEKEFVATGQHLDYYHRGGTMSGLSAYFYSGLVAAHNY